MLKKIIVILTLALPLFTSAQFFKVYPYMTPEAGEKELVYWFSAINSDHQYSFFGKNVDRNGLMAHSLELEYGLSNKWTAGLYLDFEQPAGEQLKHIKTKALMFHGRFWEKGERPVDLGLYVEYILPKKEYKDAEQIEIKIIMEKDYGFHTVVLNPTFEKNIAGPDVDEGVEFALNGGWYLKKSLTFQPGIEFYTKWGELAEMAPFNESKTYIFPAIDIIMGKHGRLIWHTGAGFGLSDPADNFVFKSILSIGFF
ncbi:hypothetical protein [Maribellus maritimus]|uniref:hypothetical protein n=1 Tax=Maribellus maritimus TaxID=2870838 RepID=UPI001EEA1F3C|nr:hypothetical protein [Maribellus maritimus]MCG6185953.1 hypothetical protein [Maribellus maritimus]